MSELTQIRKLLNIKRLNIFNSFSNIKAQNDLKSLLNYLKKQFDFAEITKQILNTSIEIRLQELFDIF